MLFGTLTFNRPTVVPLTSAELQFTHKTVKLVDKKNL